ncbi:NB-ARC [Dillenia turbinata]|uniref:NB-ARC n=1 Tax=Dillenia turbinata TaxID=194707 RepID=A0AAN8ZDA4_9MAGN
MLISPVDSSVISSPGFLHRQVRCLDLKSRFRLSKKAYKIKNNNVDKLKNKGENFTKDNVSRTAPPPPFSAIFQSDAVPLASRDSIRDKILEALKKDDVKVLGLHGMGGVGKTTIIKEVAKRAERMNLFDEILMAVVSQDPSIRKIQQQLASKLGLLRAEAWESDTDTGRAGRLHEKLKMTGKVLVILDDLWERLDLEAVGIPSPDKHKCCKIVITTREKDVCDQMDCKNNIFSPLVLSEGEGWHLFKMMAGDCVTSSEVEPVAIDVAKECGGLPLAIVVVARALKDKIPTRWKDALLQLRASAPTNIKGMLKEVYTSLKLSYDYLDGEEIKHFFLLFSLFPEDSNVSIERQMRYGMGLGLFHQAGLGGTIQEARDKADSFVDILKSACLLLDEHGKGYVRVHDVVRDFCISSIASKGQQHVFLVKPGWEFTEWPEIDSSANYTAISLVHNKIKQFPRGLNCPKLFFLFFTGENQEVNIVDTFFETMKELKVLDISRVHIPLFPPSLGLLGKLRTLRLDDCRLGEMEVIGDLKGLEVLSLNGSRFKDDKLPTGISLLTRLRLLDLSYCRGLLIPYGILSNLSRLEELYLAEWFDKWEKESEDEIYIENSGRRERYASLSELKSSSHSLTTLMGMHVKDASLFPKDLFFPEFTTFRIQIGDGNFLYDKNYSRSKAGLKVDFKDKNYSRSKAGLKVDFKGTSIAEDHWICSLMKRCDYLQLSQMGKMKRILYDFNRGLKTLVVEKSENIEEIIISEEGEAEFPQLKCLELRRLPKLASFCNVGESREPIQSQSLFSDKVRTK